MAPVNPVPLQFQRQTNGTICFGRPGQISIQQAPNNAAAILAGYPDGEVYYSFGTLPHPYNTQGALFVVNNYV